MTRWVSFSDDVRNISSWDKPAFVLYIKNPELGSSYVTLLFFVCVLQVVYGVNLPRLGFKKSSEVFTVSGQMAILRSAIRY